MIFRLVVDDFSFPAAVVPRLLATSAVKICVVFRRIANYGMVPRKYPWYCILRRCRSLSLCGRRASFFGCHFFSCCLHHQPIVEEVIAWTKKNISFTRKQKNWTCRHLPRLGFIPHCVLVSWYLQVIAITSIMARQDRRIQAPPLGRQLLLSPWVQQIKSHKNSNCVLWKRPILSYFMRTGV